MTKRKSRNKLAKKKLDVLKPLNMDEIGNDNDPCFGKHHDPTHPTCNKCGDSELCAIMQSQKLHIIRKKIEDTQEFKDVPKDNQPIKLKRSLVSKALKYVLLNIQNPMAIEMVDIEISQYLKVKISPERFQKILPKILKKNKKFIYNRGLNNIAYKK